MHFERVTKSEMFGGGAVCFLKCQTIRGHLRALADVVRAELLTSSAPKTVEYGQAVLAAMEEDTDEEDI